MIRASLTALALSLLAACTGAAPEASAPHPPAPAAEHADLVLVHGSILTMRPDAPRAEALAIRGARIAAVGSEAEVTRWVGPATKVVDLHGRTVTPGLVDAHCHLYGLGEALEELPLRGKDSVGAVAQAVAAAARGRAPGEWIMGRGWDQNRWTPAAFPDHAPLDAAAPAQPVVLERIDGHALWLNAAALAAAGIGKGTPDPPGGKILRDAAGE